jgi:hypothetical protein
VVELSHKSWLVAGLIPGVERQPIKKLEPGEKGLLDLLNCWHKQAEKAGHRIARIAKTDHFARSRPSRRRMPTLDLWRVNHYHQRHTLARLGICGFNPKLKKAPERLELLCTPEGEPIPPNTLAELQRDLARMTVRGGLASAVYASRAELPPPHARLASGWLG